MRKTGDIYILVPSFLSVFQEFSKRILTNFKASSSFARARARARKDRIAN